MPYADVFDVATPTDGSLAREGDDRIREFKRALNERLATFFQNWPNGEPLALFNASITSDKLADDAVTAQKILEGAVQPAHITDASIPISKLSNLVITNALIQDGAITNAKLADGSITNQKIVDDTIGYAKLAADAKAAVGAIGDGSIVTIKLADDAVTGDKLADNAISANHITGSAVTETKIAADAVTKAKLAPALRQTLLEKIASTNVSASPGNIVGLDVVRTTHPIPGAAIGDIVLVDTNAGTGAAADFDRVRITGEITAADTLTLSFHNTLASTTVNITGKVLGINVLRFMT